MSRREMLALLATLPGARRGQQFVYEFRGTPYEVGLQHGRALAREIRREAQPAAESLARKRHASVGEAVRRVRSRYEGLFREHMPTVLDEIHGIAEGAELSYDYAFFAATRDMMNTGACTAVAASGKQTRGGVLIGQTKDTGSPLDRFRILRIAYASGRRMVVLNYPGWIANLCLTSDGLSFTGNSLHATAPGGATVPGSFLKRLIQEKQSIREVLDAIRGMQFENGCLLIAEAAGRAVCMELAAGHVEVRDISGEAFGHANEILTPGLKRFESANGRSASSPLRQATIDRLLRAQEGGITVEWMQEAFRNHEGFPLSICRHPDPRDPDTTNAAFVADLGRREMHIAIGNPCVASFQRYVLPV
jgi:isopenicillin-N N-acyltransferase-like protein